MNDFESIDIFALTTVTGGEEAGTRTTQGGAEVTTPYGSAKASGSSTTSEPSQYLRCLDLVGRQAGVMEAGNTVADRQQKLCGPLMGK